MLKSFWFWVLVLFIAMQFFSFNTPTPSPIKENEILKAPKEVLNILKRSCYDCHSSTVKAPWYYTVAPASWYIKYNINTAREIVNFSKWGSYTKEKQLKILKKIPKAIVIRMPKKAYLYLHEEVRLTEEERKVLSSWTKELRKELE